MDCFVFNLYRCYGDTVGAELGYVALKKQTFRRIEFCLMVFGKIGQLSYFLKLSVLHVAKKQSRKLQRGTEVCCLK